MSSTATEDLKPAEPASAPRRPLVWVPVTPVLGPKLQRLSEQSGMSREDTAAKLLETTRLDAGCWSEFCPEEPAEPPPGATAKAPGGTLMVPVSRELYQSLVPLAQASDMTTGEIAAAILEGASEESIQAAIAALKNLHQDRLQDLEKPIVTGEVPPPVTATN